MWEVQKKKFGKLHWFWQIGVIIQHGLQGFKSVVKNIEGKSMEANNVSHIL